MPRRKLKTNFHIDVDSRTKDMSLDALRCRSFGHSWEEAPTPYSRRVELAAQGQMEEILVCDRCASTNETLRALPSFEVISVRRTYADPKSYLVPPKSGRLSRLEAHKARMVRLRMV